MKRQNLAGSNGAFKRAAFPVFRGWAAVAFLGFGLFQLVAVLASPEHVDLSDAILGLQIWAGLVALGGGLLLVPRQTAPYAAAAVGLALATGVVLSLTAGPSRYEWLPF